MAAVGERFTLPLYEISSDESDGGSIAQDEIDDILEIAARPLSRPRQTSRQSRGSQTPAAWPPTRRAARRTSPRANNATGPSAPRARTAISPPHRPRQNADVIDLTDLTSEVGSPEPIQEEVRPVPNSQASQHRNPRRTPASQRITPPRLSRSDSEVMAIPSDDEDMIIDLTHDSSPVNERRPRLPSIASITNMNNNPHRQASFQAPQRPLRTSNAWFANRFPDELIQIDNHILGMEGPPPRQAAAAPPHAPRPNFAAPHLARGMQGMMDFLGRMNLPRQLDYALNAFAAPPPPEPRESPKPPMEPIAPARSGFTRDTCGEPEEGEEKVAICANCGEELAYDPTSQGTVGGGGGTPSKKRKRAAGEHHFWAIRQCGHVYCADCFENRKPTKTKPDGVGFPAVKKAGSKSAIPTEVFCTVDGCDSKASTKTDWVGIYL